MGHGGGEGLRPMVKGSSGRAVDRVSIRTVLRGGEVAPSRMPRRRTKALVGWLLYCCTAVGGTAAAFTVRDTLFPSLGAPTRRAVWANATAETTLTTEHGSSSTSQPVETVTATAIPATTASTPESVEPQTVPSVSDDSQGPSTSVTGHGPSNGVPPTGTTVANPSSGPGPGTTVDDRPTDTSTPTSASTPGGPDPTAASTPADPVTSGTDPSQQSGKAKGGGGGGDPTTP